MDPVETVLSPAVGVINRRIRGSTAALDLCGELAGRVVAIRVRNTAVVVCAIIDPDGIRLTGAGDTEPDVVIEGSPAALARLGRDPQAAVSDGRVELTGDPETIKAFQRLMELAKPDLEAEAARVIGDSAANQLGELVRGVLNWGAARVKKARNDATK